MKKHIRHIAVAFSLVIVMLSQSVSAAVQETDGGSAGAGTRWEYCAGILTLSGTGAVRSYGSKTDVPWYKYAGEIESIIVGEGIYSIGNYALSGITSLTGIVLPESLENIGICAFSGCSSLERINIPKKVASIKNYAFYKCESLVSVVFEADELPDISASAFSGVATRFTVGERDYWINLSGACGTKAKWSLNDGILSITGSGAIKSYSSRNDVPWHEYAGEIETVEIGSNITGIGNYAFADLKNVNDIALPEGLKTIGTCAFSGCTGLKEITIPAALTKLNIYAFYNCSSLNRVVFKGEAPDIATTAFRGTTVKLEHPCSQQWEEISAAVFDGKVTFEDNGEHIDSSSLFYVGKTEPTCRQCGEAEHWECSVCGRFFSDAEGETEISEDELIIQKTEHVFKTGWSEDSAQHWHECINCGAKTDVSSHVYSSSSDNSCNECGHIRGIDLPIIIF